MCFLLFETTVGIFWPAYGVIKSEKIPEDIRSAVMNIFRIPLNAFVVLLLLKVKYLDSRTVFTICTLAHAVSFACYYYFYSTLKNSELDDKNEGSTEMVNRISDLDALLEKDENA